MQKLDILPKMQQLENNSPILNTKEEYLKLHKQNKQRFRYIGSNAFGESEIIDNNFPMQVIKMTIERFIDDPTQCEITTMTILSDIEANKNNYVDKGILNNIFDNLTAKQKLNAILNHSLKLTNPKHHINRKPIRKFLVNILLVFNADPEIIEDCDIQEFVNDGISPALLGKRGEEIIARYQKIKMILKYNLCNDIVNIIATFVPHEYIKNSENNNCLLM